MKKLLNIIILLIIFSCIDSSHGINNTKQNNSNKNNPKINESAFDELLFKTLERNKLEIAKNAILKGARLDEPSEARHGNTALHIIAEKGYINLFDYIYANPRITKPNLEKQNKNGETPLWAALNKDQDSIFQKLIYRNANVNACRQHNESLFYIACSKGKEEIAKMLILAGANPNIVTTYGDRSINWIARLGLNKLFLEIESLYLNNQINYSLDFQNSYCLFLALKDEQYQIFKSFLEHGTNTISIFNHDYEDILLASFNQNKKKYFNEIIKYTDLNNQYAPSGETIIHKIALKGNKHDIELLESYAQKELLKTNPNYDTLNNQNETPLYIAYKTNNLAMFECLLEQESVNADQLIPSQKKSLLVKAIQNKKNAFAKALIKKTKKLYSSIGDELENTPLHIIVKTGNVELLKDIKEIFATHKQKSKTIYIDVENSEGETLLYLAYKNKDPLMFATILSLGANPTKLMSKKLKSVYKIIEEEINQLTKKKQKQETQDYNKILNEIADNYAKNKKIADKYKNDLRLYMYMLEQYLVLTDKKEEKEDPYKIKDNTPRSRREDGDGLKNAADWFEDIPPFGGIVTCKSYGCNKENIDCEAISNNGKDFYRQLKSSTCSFNTVARMLGLKNASLNKDNYCGYVLHVFYQLHKEEVDNIINQVEEYNLLNEEKTKMPFKDTPIFRSCMCKIKEVSKKLKFKERLYEKEVQYDDEYVTKILNYLTNIKKIYSRKESDNEPNKVWGMDNKTLYEELGLELGKDNENIFEFDNEFSSILRLIRTTGMSFDPDDKDLPRVSKILNEAGIINNFKLIPNRIKNRENLFKTIKTSIDNGNPVGGSFFYGFQTEEEKEETEINKEEKKEKKEKPKEDWHAMTFIGYKHNEKAPENPSGFLIANTWDNAGKYYAFFTPDKLERCMRRYSTDGGIYYNILTIEG